MSDTMRHRPMNMPGKWNSKATLRWLITGIAAVALVASVSLSAAWLLPGLVLLLLIIARVWVPIIESPAKRKIASLLVGANLLMLLVALVTYGLSGRSGIADDFVNCTSYGINDVGWPLPFIEE